jgi:hypothetical protein
MALLDHLRLEPFLIFPAPAVLEVGATVTSVLLLDPLHTLGSMR